MKKIVFFILLAASFYSNFVLAQETLGTVSDQARISLTPVVPDASDNLPLEARPMLLGRLRQLANTQGFSGDAVFPQFILAANPILIDKKVTGTAPTKILIELEVNLYIADRNTRTIFSTTSATVKGVGSTDIESYQSAFRSLRLDNSAMKNFVSEGRNEIIKFYNTRCDLLMNRVDMLAKANQADEALEMLLQISDVSQPCAEKATAKTEQVFEAAAAQRCQALLQAAKTVWAAEPTPAGAQKAATFLSILPPGSKCNTEGNALLSDIRAQMKENVSWERTQYKDRIDLMRRYIQAIRDIGVAYGNGQPDTQIIVKGWLW